MDSGDERKYGDSEGAGGAMVIVSLELHSANAQVVVIKISYKR